MAVPEPYSLQSDEATCWYLNDKYHRESGPAIAWSTGYQEWHVHGRLHRVNGPAIVFPDGGGIWFDNGVKHRIDGPAVELANGYREWWLKGEQCKDIKNNEEFIDMILDCPTSPGIQMSAMPEYQTKRWIYKVHSANKPLTEDELNKLGSEGWELVTKFFISGKSETTFKKPA